MIKMSQTTKLGARSWSLQAVDTCPGSKNKDGSLVDACTGCYATTGAYVWSTTIAPREHNKEDWKRDAWVDDMVAALKKDKYFRWFDSGDMYALELAEKIAEVMKRTPNTKHWLPTRMAKFPKFQNVIKAMQALPNVMVRFSSDSVIGEYDARHGSTIVPQEDVAQFESKVHICDATRPEGEGKCNGCRTCWDKEVPVIGYVSHGHKMKKVIMMRKAA